MSLDPVTPVVMSSPSGNVKFEVILSPAVASPRSASSPSSQKRSMREIEQRLKAAEERRQSCENERVERAKAEGRVSKAAEKRESMEDAFKKETEAKLQQKLKAMETNREAHLNACMAKLKEADAKVEEAKARVEASKSHEKEDVTRELEAAQDRRETIIKQIKDSCAEHDKHVEAVRKAKENLTPQSSLEDNETVTDGAQCPSFM